jgi:F420-non-reducing hydrogenase large subunit
LGPNTDYQARNVIGLAKANPDLAGKVVRMRQKAKMLLERFAGKAIHPVAGVSGGFAKPMTEEDRTDMLAQVQELLDFALFTMDFAKNTVFPPYLDLIQSLGKIQTGFMGTVDEAGGLSLYDGKIRLMRPDGTYDDFAPEAYTEHIGEHVADHSYAKIPYAKSWQEGVSMDLDRPKGMYRSNCLARMNVVDSIPTPQAQAELEEFRERFGRPAQATMLYHWARLIEEVYACEHALTLLQDKEILDPNVRTQAEPKAGRGVGCVEAPRGTLIHDYSTDQNGLITRANMIVGTTHNIGPMNMSVHQAASSLIHGGEVNEEILNSIEMAVRAYDP